MAKDSVFGPIVDHSPYYVKVAGVTYWGTLERVRAWARHELDEWIALGYARTAKVYFRDGREVETFK